MPQRLASLPMTISLSVATLELVVGGELDLGFSQHDFPFAGFEVEAVGQLLSGLIEHGVFDFHRVDLRNNVE